jgi:hypothetical protein
MTPLPRWIGRTMAILMAVMIVIRLWQALQAYLHGP